MVNDAQAGFIPGKHIADNILLATELIKGYTNKGISPRCMIKVDLRKAYDSVEWSFLDRENYNSLAVCGLGYDMYDHCELYHSYQWETWSGLFLQKKVLGKETLCLLSFLLLPWNTCLGV